MNLYSGSGISRTTNGMVIYQWLCQQCFMCGNRLYNGIMNLALMQGTL